MAVAAGTLKIPIKDLVKKMTLNVTLTGCGTLKWRLKAGIVLLRIAAWVIGIDIMVKGKEGNDVEQKSDT